MLSPIGLQQDTGPIEHPRWGGASRDEITQVLAFGFGEFDDVFPVDESLPWSEFASG
jgi:hypothetical protein